jgi:ribosomal protein S18 acetylase RimI-like enzyme
MTSAYSGLWGHHVVDEEEMAHWLLSRGPDGIFLLFDARGNAVGMCLAEIREPQPVGGSAKPAGYVDAPGIVPGRRDAALYVALLLTAMHWLRAQAVGAIVLESTGDDDAILRRYTELGFATVRRAISYRLDL